MGIKGFFKGVMSQFERDCPAGGYTELKLLTKIILQYLQESFCKNSVLFGTSHDLSTQG